MENEQNRQEAAANEPKDERAQDTNESGLPGGGRGRRDEVGQSHVYNIKDDDIPPDAEIRMAGSWGGGDYNEAGGSELAYHDGVLLGGTTAGPDGEPTIDIHGGRDRPAEDAGEEDAVIGSGADVVDRHELMMRGLPKAANDESAAEGKGGAPRSQEGREQREPGQDRGS